MLYQDFWVPRLRGWTVNAAASSATTHGGPPNKKPKDELGKLVPQNDSSIHCSSHTFLTPCIDGRMMNGPALALYSVAIHHLRKHNLPLGAVYTESSVCFCASVNFPITVCPQRLFLPNITPDHRRQLTLRTEPYTAMSPSIRHNWYSNAQRRQVSGLKASPLPAIMHICLSSLTGHRFSILRAITDAV